MSQSASPARRRARAPRCCHSTAEEAIGSFAAALSGGDSEAAAVCFAPDGCLLTPDGTAVAGIQQIREVLVQLTAARSRIRFDLARVVRAGPVALCSQRWTVSSRGTGDPFERHFSSTIVLGYSKQPEDWHLLIASLWG